MENVYILEIFYVQYHATLYKNIIANEKWYVNCRSAQSLYKFRVDPSL